MLEPLVSQTVNMDELDYLAKRLESFNDYEASQFQAMASRLKLSDIRDFINLTFSSQQVTVITDFSDLEQIGRSLLLLPQSKIGKHRMEEKVGHKRRMML